MYTHYCSNTAMSILKTEARSGFIIINFLLITKIKLHETFGHKQVLSISSRHFNYLVNVEKQKIQTSAGTNCIDRINNS